MVKVAHVVCGLNFGDEGKGLMTDYLSSKFDKSITVRFNGGAQAGHTVTTPEGFRHVFSHVGSGTFVNADTYLSEYFVCNPSLFFKELIDLYNIGVRPKVYINSEAYVTTPYDIIINQIAEKRRGSNKHGSCGVGFNETIHRNEIMEDVKLNVGDLKYPSIVRETLNKIRNTYAKFRLEELGYADEYDLHRNIFHSDELLENYMKDLKAFYDYIIVADDDLLNLYDNVVFEGAQGLLLDQYHKWFPHVTRSSTGLENVSDIVNETNINDINVNYMTRVYLTRHGAGPMPYELSDKPYSKIIDETNIPNDYQGTLRFGYFNLDLINESISEDLKKCKISGKGNHRLVVTCLDQVDDIIKIVLNGELKDVSVDSFKEIILSQYPGSMFSYGPTRNTINE